eukprot:COSAG05_NODE_190_length_14625_cov_2729.566020_9_plen_46_part_00
MFGAAVYFDFGVALAMDAEWDDPDDRWGDELDYQERGLARRARSG